ncbi:MAG: T9SS type A sorting domain-containing protein [Bacteroidetes bacterium]|nr:T9SS type A sorting domain-containing protein [Bacteroidota bacterium]
MKYILILLIFISPASYCQIWQGHGTGLYSGPNIMYTDTIDNTMYIGGVFSQINGIQAIGLASWDGTNWSGLAGGIEDVYSTNYPNPTRAILRYKDYIYIGGSFLAAGGFYSKHLIRWDGDQFDSIPFPNKTVYGLKVINNYLYACGLFDSIGGQMINNFAKWDGNVWTDVYNFPKLDLDYIIDVVLYKDEFYVCGNLSNSINDPIQNIIKYDGQEWTAVANGIRGALALLYSMVIYKDELYVAGEFRKRDGNAGNAIQKWNGIEWSEVGGGFDENAQVRKLYVHKDKLYAVGGFDFAGGVEAHNIAIWDGDEWCGLGSKFDNVISSLAFFNDTLIIGGGFWTIDGDSIQKIAKWIGGDYVDSCGVITNIDKSTFENNILKLFPNPTNGHFNIEFIAKNNQASVEVYNNLGTKVFSISNFRIGENKVKIDISEHPEGIYIFNVFDGEKIFSKKVIKNR